MDYDNFFIRILFQGSGDVSKQPRKKAKLLRQERNQLKRQLKGLPPVDLMAAKAKPKNAEKTLEELINDVPDDAKHKLKVP